ncbi:hypothetical protein PFISCL1PPCAC_28773, partial [Pristionchus fissidentatus]
SVFPIPRGGNCTAMLTESSMAQWINEDCDNQKLPFICRRHGYSTVRAECTLDALIEGKDNGVVKSWQADPPNIDDLLSLIDRFS